MSNEATVKSKVSHLVTGEWNRERIELLKRTICKDATDDEFELFIGICKRSGLDPFTRQIHAVKRWNDRAGRYDMIVQTGIDGYRLTAQRTGAYAGSDDPIFDDEVKPSRATVTVHRMVMGIRCAFTATARWDEYYPGDKQGFMWRKMPCVMLGKCAEAQALRKAFPAELSDIYTDEELEQAAAPSGVTPGRIPEPGNGVTVDEYCCSNNLAKSFPALVKKPISKCDPALLREACNAIQKKADTLGKAIPEWAQEFIDHAAPIIGRWENEQPQSPEALELEPGDDG